MYNIDIDFKSLYYVYKFKLTEVKYARGSSKSDDSTRL